MILTGIEKQQLSGLPVSAKGLVLCQVPMQHIELGEGLELPKGYCQQDRLSGEPH